MKEIEEWYNGGKKAAKKSLVEQNTSLQLHAFGFAPAFPISEGCIITLRFLMSLANKAFEAAQRLPDEAQRSMILERIEAAQQLSNAVQGEELERILDKIDELEWDAIVSKPYVKQRLRELGRKAMEEDRAGETEKGGVVGEEMPLNNSTQEPLTEEKRAERAERIMESIMSKPQKGMKFLQMAGIVEERISPEKD